MIDMSGNWLNDHKTVIKLCPAGMWNHNIYMLPVAIGGG